MATMTISLPDPMKDWIEAQVRQGEYASASDYLRDLVRRDRARREQEFTLEGIRRKLVASRESGVTDRTVNDIFTAAYEIAKTRGLCMNEYRLTRDADADLLELFPYGFKAFGLAQAEDYRNSRFVSAQIRGTRLGP